MCLQIVSIIRLIISFVIRLFIPRRCKDIGSDVILVTGGGRGLGRRIALVISSYHPHHIILWGRNEEHLAKSVSEIQLKHTQASYMVCDVRNRDDIYKKIADIKHSIGDVTILVNNAGMVIQSPVTSLTSEEFEDVIKVNTLASVWTCKAVLPGMRTRGRGHIVTMNSELGLSTLPYVAGYITSKYALTGFHEALQDELMSNDETKCIRMTSVHPYQINNPMFSVKIRFPSLFPPISENQVAKETVDAILYNKHSVVIPAVHNVLIWMTRWMPVKASQAVLQFTGVHKCMLIDKKEA